MGGTIATVWAGLIICHLSGYDLYNRAPAGAAGGFVLGSKVECCCVWQCVLGKQTVFRVTFQYVLTVREQNLVVVHFASRPPTAGSILENDL